MNNRTIICPLYMEKRQVLKEETKKKRDMLGYPPQDFIIKMHCKYANTLVGGCEKKLVLNKRDEYLCSVLGIVPAETVKRANKP